MKPRELALSLGISPKHLRDWLRENYPRPAEQWHARWNLTREQVAAARARFEGGPIRAESREGMVVTTVALPESVHAGLVRAAKQIPTSLTQLLALAAAEWLERNSRKPRGRK